MLVWVLDDLPFDKYMFTGSEIYSRHRGYGDTFEWMGDYVDRTSR